MALFKKRTAGKPGEWYYCLEHKKVEEGPECPSKNRFGPYTTREGGLPRHGDRPRAEPGVGDGPALARRRGKKDENPE